jgi:hypothetical protein
MKTVKMLEDGAIINYFRGFEMKLLQIFFMIKGIKQDIWHRCIVRKLSNYLSFLQLLKYGGVHFYDKSGALSRHYSKSNE